MSILVIVESPAKIKKISSYLGQGYVIAASFGHIRDLPSSKEEIPEKYKDKPWAMLGIDIEDGFKPLYVASSSKKGQIAQLKKLASTASKILLATDPDREGEAIAWHLEQVLKPTVPTLRITFNEITEDAVKKAVQNPRQIDLQLVAAQATRRMVDRLFGFKVSPVLSRALEPKLSAGRVQSVAVKLLSERELERMRFGSASYCQLYADLKLEKDAFKAQLFSVGDQLVAQGKDFNSKGQLKVADRLILEKKQADELAAALKGQTVNVETLEQKPFSQSPAPPFITSSLQQEGSRKLGFSAEQTMKVAQTLYEGGHITYMRTDSPNLSDEALSAARKAVLARFGEGSVPQTPRQYASKNSNAQEAHEAIRPSGKVFKAPEETGLQGEFLELYTLIYLRTLASQMNNAEGYYTTAILKGNTSLGPVGLGARGKTILEKGYLALYQESSDEEDNRSSLPEMTVGQTAKVQKLEVKQTKTQPPARYSEAGLIQALEKGGIGRPSTYAAIMANILQRGYCSKRKNTLIATWKGIAVTQYLEGSFADLLDYGFTKMMEQGLDSIAAGEGKRIPYLQAFWDTLEPKLRRPASMSALKVPHLEEFKLFYRAGQLELVSKTKTVSFAAFEEPDLLSLQKAREILEKGSLSSGTPEKKPRKPRAKK
jgi:DNA topoisomerase I